MPYIRATIAYDGTDFLGFQWQAGGRTIQSAIETALGQVAQEAVRVVGSGRTDSGVHARGQVIGFNTAWRHSLADLQRALNAVLDPDVAVLELHLAPPGWHPRFSALRRHYRYTVLNETLRSPLDRRYAYWVPEPLDLTALRAASEFFVGEHDFASFGRPMPRRFEATGSGSTVRRVFSAGWQQSGSWFTFDVVGNAYLRSMVRSLVGTLLEVGRGAWSVGRFVSVLTACNRALAAPPAPACGLCLMRVDYDGQFYKEQQT